MSAGRSAAIWGRALHPANWERRTSRAAVWSRRLAVFSAVLFLVSGLSHRLGLLATPDFIPVLGLVGVLAALALLCAAWGFSRVWRFGDRGGRAVAWGTVVAFVVLAPFAYYGWLAATLPRLTGVSTDLIDPPHFSRALLSRRPPMNPIGAISAADAAAQRQAYPEVTGRRYDLALPDVLDEVEKLIAERGWQITGRFGPSQAGTDVTIEAFARTPILGYPQDVAVRLTNEALSTFVDMRSVSRYGGHDLGDNARRVASFMADLDVAIANRPPQ